MLLFEKSLIGAYCNRLHVYDLGQRHGPFSCYGRSKANSAGKNLNGTNIYTKVSPPNCHICLPPNSSFLYESKRSQFGRCFGYLGDAINYDHVSPPLHLYKLRKVICDINFSFRILPVLINKPT